MPQVISGAGGQFEVAANHRDVICILDSGDVLITQSGMSDPVLRSTVSRAGKFFNAAGTQLNLKQVDIATIKLAYQKFAAKTADTSFDASQMQKEAMKIFKDAVERKASDIHIRIEDGFAVLLYRIHNDLIYISELQENHARALLQSIYVSMTDVSDTVFKENGRQDARISDRKKLPEELHGLRIATSPTVGGMLMVMRLLYNTGNKGGLMDLGYSKDHMTQVAMMMKQPYGINFISGPTGSGKSTTLQRTLAHIYQNTNGQSHIITVEDPPEYPIMGAVQCPVVAESEQERGEAFRAAIRSVMRLDPDVIMIGEVRDLESAQLAIDAAMTGHQVWTTVHANNAMAILDRLIEIGVPMSTLCDPALITGLVAQRLVKTLCEHCKIPFAKAVEQKLLDSALIRRVHTATEEDVTNIHVRNHEGCEHCTKGVSGRTVVSEIIIPDTTLCDHLRRGDRTAARHYWEREQNGSNMLKHCLFKIRRGHVDPNDAEQEMGPLTMNIIRNDDKVFLSEVKEALGEAPLETGLDLVDLSSISALPAL